MQTRIDDGPATVPVDRTEPEVLPDVATSPHPLPHDEQPNPADNGGQLQEVLPQIHEVAKKVGGFKRLAEIAEQLDSREQ